MKWRTDDEFHAAMDINPKAVYVAELYGNGECTQRAIFSTKQRVEDWLAKPEFEEMTGVVVPYIIDEPDFGNLKKGDMA